MVASNRITFLALFDEFDCKAKFSGRGRIHNKEVPHDMLGFFLVRIGIPLCAGPRPHCSCYRRVEKALGVKQIHPVWSEIDKANSTNQSIKAVTLKVFQENPI